MKSGNPALKTDTFIANVASGESMTLAGVVHKTALLVGLAVISAAWSWQYVLLHAGAVAKYLLLAVLAGAAMALLTVFFKKAAPWTAPLYAVLEGVVIGSVSALLEAKFPGIVLQAVGLTFGTLIALLAAYRSGYIRPSENFKLFVVSATGGIFLLYLVNIGLMFAGHRITFVHESGFWGIAFSCFVVVIAALNLVMDFDFIEAGVAQGSPKHMEWYGAFALVVTLVWLYLEILHLLSKSRR